MAQSKRMYFLVKKNGSTMRVWNEWKEKMDLCMKAWESIMKKHKTKRLYRSNNLLGLFFSRRNIPEGWVSPSSLPDGFYRPARKKVCIESYREWKALPVCPDWWTLAKLMKARTPVTDGRVHLPSIEEVGGKTILSLHEDEAIPGDVTPLKKSRYWSLKEANS